VGFCVGVCIRVRVFNFVLYGFESVYDYGSCGKNVVAV
jgi:hypothetical protein